MKEQKGMKMGYKIAAYLGTTILTAIVTAGMQSLSFLDERAYIAVILILALVCCSIYIVLCEKNMSLTNDLSEKSSKLEESNQKLKESNQMSEDFGVSAGDSYLAMSFTQGWSLKIEYLKKSKESRNLIAALTLANIYDCGIEADGEVILEKDYEKAAKIYKDFESEDKSGVCSWMLGWYYENRKIKDAQDLSEDDSLVKAREYYETSKEKKFAKAFNSIGKFKLRGWAQYEKSDADADIEFIKAEELKDFYAYNNRGLSSMKKYDKEGDRDRKEGHLSDAKKSFTESAKFGSTEAELQLGMICEIQAKKAYEVSEKNESENNTSNIPDEEEKTCAELISEAKTHYIKALEKHDKKITAPALYKLGKLISEHPKLAEDHDLKEALTKMGKIRFNDLAVECMMRAYEEYEKVGDDTLGLEYGGMYTELKDSISGIFKKELT